jgi:hypothetical protein
MMRTISVLALLVLAACGGDELLPPEPEAPPPTVIPPMNGMPPELVIELSAEDQAAIAALPATLVPPQLVVAVELAPGESPQIRERLIPPEVRVEMPKLAE